MKFEDAARRSRRTSPLGNFLTGTSLSLAAGELVPVLYDPDDHSSFIVDEGKMVDDQKAWLEPQEAGVARSSTAGRSRSGPRIRLPPTPG